MGGVLMGCGDEGSCIGCEEEMPSGECPHSLRPCGHHCNGSWIPDMHLDHCCWCGANLADEPSNL